MAWMSADCLIRNGGSRQSLQLCAVSSQLLSSRKRICFTNRTSRSVFFVFSHHVRYNIQNEEITYEQSMDRYRTTDIWSTYAGYGWRLCIRLPVSAFVCRMKLHPWTAAESGAHAQYAVYWVFSVETHDIPPAKWKSPAQTGLFAFITDWKIRCLYVIQGEPVKRCFFSYSLLLPLHFFHP